MDDHHGPEHLHAPWRMEYVTTTGEKREGCVFCDIPREKTDEENLLIYRGDHTFVVMNAFPYNNGHLMVIPYRHTAELTDLPCATLTEMMRLASLSMRALRRVMSPDGFNLGMNLGRAAGAGIADHLHLHVVPRWNGDTNFMPVVGNIRVLPEALEKTWQKVHGAFQQVLVEEGTENL